MSKLNLHGDRGSNTAHRVDSTSLRNCGSDDGKQRGKTMTMTCAKLQKALELLRDLHDFGNPTTHVYYDDQAKKAWKDAADFLREHEPIASVEATESKGDE
jgi:hypothetical protein